MTKFVNPSATETAFNCPVCGTYTQQFWYEAHLTLIEGKDKLPCVVAIKDINNIIKQIRSKIDETTVASEYDKLEKTWKRNSTSVSKNSPFVNEYRCESSEHSRAGNVHFSKCFNCEEFSIWFGENLIHPVRDKHIPINADMPDDVKLDFEEARSIVDKSPRSAAILLRLCIEKICKHLGCTGDLNNMIGQLVERGLSVKIQQALDTVRVTGGQAAHPLQMDLKDDVKTAISLFQIVNIIVERMITEEKNIAEMYKSLPVEKLKAIEKRDGQ